MRSNARREHGESRRVSFGGLADKLLLISALADENVYCGYWVSICPFSHIMHVAIFFVLAVLQGGGT